MAAFVEIKQNQHLEQILGKCGRSRPIIVLGICVITLLVCSFVSNRIGMGIDISIGSSTSIKART